jgi:hypothetical protein
MAEELRYSEKRLKDGFTAYVLLTEPLAFRPSEILAAVREDFPGLAWTDRLEADLPFTAGEVSLGVLFPDRDETNEPSVVQFASFPGRCDVDWDHVVAQSHLANPRAADAVARHVCWLSIRLDSVDSTLAARFDAARRVTCLAAVFARLPICLGIYFPSSDSIVTPAAWIEAASSAMRAEVAFPAWVSFYVNAVPDGRQPVPVTVGTIGMAAFLGHEVVLPLARTEPAEAAKWVYGAVRLLIERGHIFRDSNTLGVDGEGEVKLRIRHATEGMMELQTDHWVLLHSATTIDEMAVFGERTGMPPPEGFDNTVRGDEDALKKRLYAFAAGERGRARPI